MPKIELDVDLIQVQRPVRAETGDYLMMFGGLVIGVVPRNSDVAEGRVSLSSGGSFDEDRVLRHMTSSGAAETVAQLNRRFGWTGSPAAGQLGRWLRDQLDLGVVEKVGENRYPAFRISPRFEK